MGMDSGENGVDEAMVEALSVLVNGLCTAMCQAASEGVLTPRGVLFAAAAAMRVMAEKATEIDGWSAQQARDFAFEALTDAFEGDGPFASSAAPH